MEVLQDSLEDSIVNEDAQVVTVSSSMEPVEAFKILLENRIQSAPVWHEEEGRYIGFIELRDLVCYALAEVHKDDVCKGAESTFYTEGIPERGYQHVTYLARRNPYKPFQLDQTVGEAITCLARKRCHRLPVVNNDGELIYILSQTSIIQFLNSRVDAFLGGIGDKTIEELNIGTYPLITVKDTLPAHAALELVDNKGISGVGIVDSEDGTLVGNTSGSDLHIFLRDGASLAMPVLDFFAQARQDVTGIDRAATITCTKDQTLAKVIAKLAKTKVHRIYVVDEEKRPLGIISVQDICRVFARFLPKCTRSESLNLSQRSSLDGSDTTPPFSPISPTTCSFPTTPASSAPEGVATIKH
uniref:CBS domain-containing protein n=1 Tax=Pyramimonas obovata TaxID=1411642 RepID=A0A7S0WHK0_9CHLO|mmetsp:Transcript_25860/g.56131  ORF Transcript_25860/g.56131 Transcript_25860/m.56131 type:complete len:357 (+) Transcript_25860:155-1225(+)